MFTNAMTMVLSLAIATTTPAAAPSDIQEINSSLHVPSTNVEVFVDDHKVDIAEACTKHMDKLPVVIQVTL